jgi:hypothetical protein
MKISARKVIFWTLVVGGVGLIIAGIFVPALAVAGAAIVATAAVVGSGLTRQEDQDHHIDQPAEYLQPLPEVLAPASLDESYSEPPDMSVTFQFRIHYAHHRLAQMVPDQKQDECDIETYRKECSDQFKHRYLHD